MGGKKYNKDGSKKVAPKNAEEAKRAPGAGQQPSIPREPTISQATQQMSLNEPIPSTSGLQPGLGEQQSRPQAWQPQQDQQRSQSKPEKSQTQGKFQGKRKQLSDRSDESNPQQNEPQAGLSRAELVRSVKSTLSGMGPSRSKAVKPETSSRGKPQEQAAAPNKFPKVILPNLGKGTSGRPLGMIETNYLKLVNEDVVNDAYQYDIIITTKGPKKLQKEAFKKFNETILPRDYIAFDGKKIAYSPRPLNIDKEIVGEVTITHPETKKNWDYTVTIKPAENIKVPIKQQLTNYQTERNQDAEQAIEIILKGAFQQYLNKGGIQSGRRFFLPSQGQRIYLKDFCELRLGLFQSMVIGEYPLLNVDVSHKAFPKRYDSIIDLLYDMQREMSSRDRPFRIDLNKPLIDICREKLEAHLAGLDICYSDNANNKRIYKFFSLGNAPARETFAIQNGDRHEETNVSDYFKNMNRSIRYPGLQCIKLGRRDRYISVPMEFCSIPDSQVVNKKCTENQTREMIRVSAGTTDDRKKKIMDLLHAIKHNESPIINAFGLKIDANFIDVPARQLDTPSIMYKDRKTVKPQRGAWRMDSQKFLDSKTNIKWIILNVNRNYENYELDEFAKQLYNCSTSNGLQLDVRPLEIVTILPKSRDFDFTIRRKMQQIADSKQSQNSIGIVFCVIPNAGPIYAKIKQIAELHYGVLTQCVKGITIDKKRRDLSTVSNILLKVNAKLNGTNHKLANSAVIKYFDREPMMIIGADVTHPTPGQQDVPSVVGVVASHDLNAFCYNIAWRYQTGEIIADLKTIVKKHLQFFKQHNGFFPKKILYYRDGVSESQFDEVMATEKQAIAQACHDVYQVNEKIAKLTIIIVQKRHHTRFFPGQTGISTDKNNNVPPGTIVDTDIIRPDESHFYLVSHQAVQGVAKPTKYCILLDEANHKINDIHTLTFNLCHMFARCNRSVSYPAPTYYAHHAAARGKVYIAQQPVDMNDLDAANKRCNIKIINTNPNYFV